MAEGGSPQIQSRNNYSDPMQQSQQGNGEEELATRTLHIQSKRFYLDVKQNRRGRFIKIAEVSAGGRKSRILMSMNVATELRDHLQTFDEHIRTLSEYNPTNVQSNEDGRLRSATITRDDRKYYLDLKENDRGRFLRISMVGPNAPRTQIALPVQGVQELRETLASLLDEFGNEDDKDSIESPSMIELSELPESKYLRVGNKHFYFDIGSNNRGIFLRISEVRGNVRTAITIPEKAWSRVRDNVDDFILKMNNERHNLSTEISSGQDERTSMPPSGTDAKKT